jgi:hypothetical protein
VFLSSSLNAVAPFMGLKALSTLPDEIEQAVKTLNARTYGKLAYEFTDPAADGDLQKLSQADNLLLLTWPASADGKVTAGKGVIGLLVEHRGRKIALPLIDVVRLPIVGTQYKLAGAEDVSRMLNNSVESLSRSTEAWFWLTTDGAIMGGGTGQPQTIRRPTATSGSRSR